MGYLLPLKFSDKIEGIRDFISQFGILAPIIFVIFQIIQVIIPPISHQTISLLGGLIFGFGFGFLLNWIGRVLGASFAFYLSRRFGRDFVKRKVSKDVFEKFDNVINEHHFLIFLMYILPFFPDDEISYILGISDMKFSRYLAIIGLGHITGSLFAAGIGSGFFQKNIKTFIIAFVPSIVLFLIITFFNPKRMKINS